MYFSTYLGSSCLGGEGGVLFPEPSAILHPSINNSCKASTSLNKGPGSGGHQDEARG